VLTDKEKESTEKFVLPDKEKESTKKFVLPDKEKESTEKFVLPNKEKESTEKFVIPNKGKERLETETTKHDEIPKSRPIPISASSPLILVTANTVPDAPLSTLLQEDIMSAPLPLLTRDGRSFSMLSKRSSHLDLLTENLNSIKSLDFADRRFSDNDNEEDIDRKFNDILNNINEEEPSFRKSVSTKPQRPVWQQDKASNTCSKCNLDFTVWRRRHHCRNCGKIYCSKCCNQRAPLKQLGYVKPQLICAECVFQDPPSSANNDGYSFLRGNKSVQ